eukprot:935294-Rhodomonas_salina.2
MLCPVLRTAVTLRICCAMSGTELGDLAPYLLYNVRAAWRQEAEVLSYSFAMQCPVLRYVTSIVLRLGYAMPGTGIGHTVLCMRYATLAVGIRYSYGDMLSLCDVRYCVAWRPMPALRDVRY